MKDKVVLVTGGTGSFGKTMVQHLLNQGCGEIRILSRDEWKQHDMRRRFSSAALKFFIGDVRSRASVDGAMNGVDLVFHAAALKQVPSCEFFPMQAVETNIVGSNNVIESAISHDVSRVVCLGTDKAVFPVNAMGMSKALMEKNVQAHARRLGPDATTRLCSVRYGNVMYSRGSVIPLFVEQIRKGEPLTITEPKMTRFLMPLFDAVDLVEFAFQNANQGDLFIKKAPAATIEDLARAVRNVFRSNVEIRKIGMRHGEKMHEALASAAELRRAEDLGEYWRIEMDDRNLDYSRFYTKGDTQAVEFENFDSSNTTRLNVDETEELLMTLPEVKQELGLMDESLPTSNGRQSDDSSVPVGQKG